MTFFDLIIRLSLFIGLIGVAIIAFHSVKDMLKQRKF